MILTLIAILALAAIGAALMFYSVRLDNENLGDVGGIIIVCAALGLLVFLWYAPDWVAAKYKADIVNREYGTTYTQAEMFYAGEVIDVVRELDRKRYQVRIDKDTP